jgi:hypothetical protein
MKKILCLLSVCFVLVYTSCKKEGTVTLLQPDTTKSITAVPVSFSQKVLIEEFASTWYGNCPTADYYLNQYLGQVNSQYPDRVYGTTIHVADVMEAPELQFFNAPFIDNVLDTMFNNTGGYPIAMANRNDPDPLNISWMNCAAEVPGLLGQNPKCGLAIDARMDGNVLNLSVHAGFRVDVLGEYRLHVYLVETSVHSSDSLYDQANTTIDPQCPYFNSPNPIHNYTHANVLRKVISTGGNGEAIPAVNMRKGKQYIKNYTVNLSNFSWGSCSIIAFVDKYADYAGGHRIMNVQKVAVGSLKNWD